MAGCTRPIHPDDGIGEACPACGHTNLVHPSHVNPSLAECAICQVLAVVDVTKGNT